MSYDKAKVTIDLNEYNDLLSLKKLSEEATNATGLTDETLALVIGGIVQEATHATRPLADILTFIGDRYNVQFSAQLGLGSDLKIFVKPFSQKP